MPLITNSPTNPDPTTGTRRLDLWSDSAEGGSYGDNARGTAYSARYLSDREGDGLCAEVAIYPVLADDKGPEGEDIYDVIEQATIGKATQDEGSWRPDDSADIEYEWLNTMALTLEQAEAFAKQRGEQDQSFAIYLRPKESK